MACNLHSIFDFQKHSIPEIVFLRSLFVNWQKLSWLQSLNPDPYYEDSL